jgi:1-acyl-sn-glycerol-3-phosphate acyltransferase
MFHFTMLLVRLVNWLIFRLHIEGRQQLQSLKDGLLVSNHTLVLDPGIIAHTISPKRTYFTMLEETACIPLLGTFVRLLGAVPIPAEAAAMRMLERAIRTDLRDLPFIHLFPEGECYLWNQQVEEFQLGAFYLACRLRLPVIPVTTVLHRRRWFGRDSFRFGNRTFRIPPQVTVVVGEAIHPNGNQSRSLKGQALDLGNRVRTVMQQTIDRNDGCKDLAKGRMPRLAAQHN